MNKIWMKHNVTGLLDQNRIERILTNLVNKLGSKDLPSILYSFFLGKQNQRGPKHSVSFSGGGGGGLSKPCSWQIRPSTEVFLSTRPPSFPSRPWLPTPLSPELGLSTRRQRGGREAPGGSEWWTLVQSTLGPPLRSAELHLGLGGTS